MFSEMHAEGLRYDDAKDTADLLLWDGDGEDGGPIREAESVVDLLLDKRGYLVGIDLGGQGARRAVIMMGRHEDVAEIRSTHVRIARQDGQILLVRVANARTQIRAHEPNPYVKRAR